MRTVHIQEISITPRETKAFKIYLKELNKCPILTTEEEYNLFIKKANGDTTVRDKILAHNLRFVVSVAKKFYSYSLTEGVYEFADLVSAGNEGLVVAIDKYDHTRGFKFISYAVWYIQQRIMDFINKTKAIALPYHISSLVAKTNREIYNWESIEQRPLAVEDVIFRMGYEPNIIEKIYKGNYFLDKRNMIRLDDNAPDYNSVFDNEFFSQDDERLNHRYSDNLKDESEFTQPDYQLNKEGMLFNIDRALTTLSNREIEVICLCFGLYGDELSLEEAGKRLNQTRERIRQIRDKAIRRLKHSSRHRILMQHIYLHPNDKYAIQYNRHHKYKFKTFVDLLIDKSQEYKEEKKQRIEKIIDVVKGDGILTLYCMNCGVDFQLPRHKISHKEIRCHRCNSPEIEVDNKNYKNAN